MACGVGCTDVIAKKLPQRMAALKTSVLEELD
jgi:hypothetical protein